MSGQLPIDAWAYENKTFIMKKFPGNLLLPVVLFMATGNISYAFTGLPAYADLPVTWLYLKTAINDNSVSVNWGTMAEPYNHRFELERSEDGRSFHVIASLSGRGDITNNHYEAMDSGVRKGTTYYYRINMIGPDALPTYSPIVAVRLEKDKDNNLVRLFPNPVSETLIVNLNVERAQTGHITIADLNGSTRFCESVQKTNNSDSNFPIQVGGWPAGWYVLKIITSNGDAQVVRFFIKR